MKSEKIYDGITNIREDIILRVEKSVRKRRKKWWISAVAAVLVLAMIGGAILLPGRSPFAITVQAIAVPSYPEMTPYPNADRLVQGGDAVIDYNGGMEEYIKQYEAWKADLEMQQREVGYADGLETFFLDSTRQFLSGEGNRIYSPLNVYMALGAMAELTEGESRQQILNLLGSADIDALRQQASDVWNATYRQDGLVSSTLATSVWLDENVSFRQEIMDALADTYYTSSYRGSVGSAEMNEAFRSWIGEQTGGLLQDTDTNLNPDSMLTMASTVHFYARWMGEFSEAATEKGTFHGATGEIVAEFMHKRSNGTYYWGEKFSAVDHSMENGGRMWFILPEEGTSASELLQEENIMKLVMNADNWENQKNYRIHCTVPKFDVTCRLELRSGLEQLGIKNVFDGELSDFSPMTEDADGLAITGVQHNARVFIDEDGAYSAMLLDEMNTPGKYEEIEFTVDRPFLFVVTTADELPLFAGIVNHPVS